MIVWKDLEGRIWCEHVIIIVVVVVVDDDTYCWIYLSSDHLFQVYYKVRQVLSQSATGITKCDNFITKCDRYYKVRRLLQSATLQTGEGTTLKIFSVKGRNRTDEVRKA